MNNNADVVGYVSPLIISMLADMRKPGVFGQTSVIFAEEFGSNAIPLVKADSWTAVADRFPDDWGSTLIRNSDGTDIAWFQLKDGGNDGLEANKWYQQDNRDGQDYEVYGVTHWMPLPAAPIAEPVVGAGK